MQTTLRNTDLETLTALLREQQEAKVDLVVPGKALQFIDGNLHVDLPEPILAPYGVTSSLNLNISPEMIGDLATRAEIPVRYLRKLAEGAVIGTSHGDRYWRELFDKTLSTHYKDASRASKRYLIRGFHGSDGIGAGRALLSDSYKAIDNLDVLLSTLQGVSESGAEVEVTQCNITPRSMRVRFAAPGIRALAPELLGGYRNPFEQRGLSHGQAGLRDGDGNLPIVFAGFEVSNSEIGGGAAKATPILTAKVCNNGIVLNLLANAHRHTGGKLDEGTIKWSADTQKKSLDLITAQTRDVVSTFLTEEFVSEQIAALTAKAGKPVDHPVETIEEISQKLGWTEAEQDSILGMFIRGGQANSGGIMHAVTAAAQEIEDPDRAWAIEAAGVRAMELV